MAHKLHKLALSRISDAGLRPTTARVAIVESLLKTRDHPSADELTTRLGKDGHRIGRATVYQNLERLLEAGAILCLTTEDGLRRFDATLEPHQHMVCAKTGRIFDVFVDEKLLRKLQPLDPATGKPLKYINVGQVRVQFICQ